MKDLGRPYKSFLASASISALGDGMLLSGLQLLSHRYTTNQRSIALIFGIGKIPWALALVIGSLTDRGEAKRIMIGADAIRAFTLGVLGLLLFIAPGRAAIWWLYVVTTLLAFASVAFFTASQRVIGVTVSAEQLPDAFGYLDAAGSAGEQLIGPALGGAIFAGGKVPVVGDALTFVASGFLLRKLPKVPGIALNEPLREVVAIGWRSFKESSEIKHLTGVVAALGFLQSSVVSVLVVVGKDTLGLGDRSFATLLALVAAGNVVGGITAARLVRKLQGLTLPFAAFVSGAGYLLCVGSRSTAMVTGALFLEGVAISAGGVYVGTARQRLTEPQVRGRVIGMCRAVVLGVMVPGALFGGEIARRWGTDRNFLVSGIGLVAVGFVCVPSTRQINIKLEELRKFAHETAG
jgi:MFS family permease